ncbi:MipA/OmpV family protein [Aliikangiella coralliicola]|uniref:MipA/OmpV family protein n=1 Tax=Aliikangiella coralliicola TaxID=2592383 RepID=A0A545UEX0_9GAMM|nr:MipA/OmpV family protein [Aliikangiella coralliicola]TQV88032.1 MipA/OmpV family protein [Aliikangiella coralliicola]
MKILFISLFALYSFSAFAFSGENNKEESFILGPGVFSIESPYIGGKTQTMAFPYIEYSWGPLFIEGGTLGSHIFGGDNWGIAAAIDGDFLGDTDRGDSNQLADMQELDDVINGSIKMFYHQNWGAIELSLSKDISDNHDGSSASLSYSYVVELGNWEVIPSVGANWFSEDVSNYYYGVSLVDARANRPFYSPDSGVNYNAGISTIYSFDKNNSLMLNLTTESYSDQIKDSSIVDKSGSTTFGSIYIHRF